MLIMLVMLEVAVEMVLEVVVVALEVVVEVVTARRRFAFDHVAGWHWFDALTVNMERRKSIKERKLGDRVCLRKNFMAVVRK